MLFAEDDVVCAAGTVIFFRHQGLQLGALIGVAFDKHTV